MKFNPHFYYFPEEDIPQSALTALYYHFITCKDRMNSIMQKQVLRFLSNQTTLQSGQLLDQALTSFRLCKHTMPLTKASWFCPDDANYPSAITVSCGISQGWVTELGWICPYRKHGCLLFRGTFYKHLGHLPWKNAERYMIQAFLLSF